MSTTTELSDEHRLQLEYIEKELETFLDDELFHQGIERLDMILGSMGEAEDYRLLRGAVLSRRAELHLELEDDEAAWGDAQKAMNFGWYDANVYEIAGWSMYHMEELEVAKDQFDRALELDAGRIGALTGRAMVTMELEEWDAARVDLSRAIQLAEDNASAYALRADVEIALGTMDAARRDIEKARALDSEDPDYALSHARLLMVAGELDLALTALGDAITDEDAALEALLLRSHIKTLKGDAKGAKKDAMRASNSYPEEAFSFVQLAQVQLAAGNASLALKAAERAVKLDPSLPDAYVVRGAAHQLEGDEETANEDFARAKDEPIELPMFLMGPTYHALDPSSFMNDVLTRTGGTSANDDTRPGAADAGAAPGNPFENLKSPIPGLGLNPMTMLNQIFDDEGNIKPTFKPILKMAMKNAPSLLKTVPPGMLKNMGGIDPNMLDGVNPDDISEEQLEAQMRLFYKMMKNGQNPMDIIKDQNGDK